jgi:hypothetical protein
VNGLLLSLLVAVNLPVITTGRRPIVGMSCVTEGYQRDDLVNDLSHFALSFMPRRLGNSHASHGPRAAVTTRRDVRAFCAQRRQFAHTRLTKALP